jgi:predicted phage tail protein
LYFRAIVGIINETLRYPNSALVGIKVSSENFQSVPEISALLQGIKIRVPTIYNSSSNSYSGIWDGSFKVEYNNNPVWVFYDLLTNARYGAGLFIEQEDIDIYGLLPIAKYCDEMVPNGRAGRKNVLHLMLISTTGRKLLKC